MNVGGGVSRRSSLWKGFVRICKKIFRGREYNYSETVLWYLYGRFLPKTKGLKIAEIGSAPGWNLLNFKERLGYVPFGIEYSHVGAEQNRKKFIAAGVPAENVIEADFFSQDLHQQYKEYFDVVMSGGFVEHFDNPKDVIQKHLDLLRPGGYLIVTVPNFQGVNSILAKFFNKDIVRTHNFGILHKEGFRSIFPGSDKVHSLYCNYFGTTYFGVYAFDYQNNGKMKYLCYRFLVRFQVVLNVLFSIIFGEKGAETRWLSPYIIFIGQKI